MRQARLSIFIGHGKPIPQGKIYKKEDKWIFLANITDAKWFNNYSGYAISAQILEAFTKAKIRPRIIYNLYEKGIKYETTKSKFYSKGILVPFGNHRQYCLPIKNWKVCREDIKEPFGLPDLTIGKWIKGENPDAPVQISMDVRLRLKEEFNKKYATA